jgi:putative ABC transport system permease protein
MALKMLFGDWARYATLVFGLSFSVLLITQQTAIFLGILIRSTGPLQNIGQADIWVASEYTYHVDQMRPMRDKQVYRIRSMPGVAWAEPFFFFYAVSQLNDGSFTIVNVVGIDRMSLVGRPPEMIAGRLEDLRLPDAVVVDERGREQLNGVNVGDVIRLQDRRALVVGICRAKRGLLSKPLLYTTFDNATRYVPLGRQRVSYVLTKVKPGHDIGEVAASINALPDIWAFTADQMRWQSIKFILTETGIGINFGVTVLLGLIVGLIVSVATFSQFTADNLRHYAVFKAMGAGAWTLIGMIITQAVVVTLISYGIGIGLAGLVSMWTRGPDAEFVAYLPWQLMVGVMLPLIVCVGFGSVISLRRVLRLEPATVFA